MKDRKVIKNIVASVKERLRNVSVKSSIGSICTNKKSNWNPQQFKWESYQETFISFQQNSKRS